MPGLLVPLEDVLDLLGVARQQVGGLARGVWSIGSSVMTNQIMLHMSKSVGEGRGRARRASRSISPFQRLMSSGESWMPIQPCRPYFAMRWPSAAGP
jgi:hypothetical protein